MKPATLAKRIFMYTFVLPVGLAASALAGSAVYLTLVSLGNWLTR